MDFTYNEAKELIQEIGRFEEESYDYYGLTVLKADNGEYAIGTDEECDEAWEENLDNYIEDCVLPEMPEHLQSYFDDESFKRDCRYDGRAHSLSTYDGNELNIGEYYLYRIN